MPAKDGTRGFTLIELMVTVAIIGLGMTIVFFQIENVLPGTRLQSACRSLASDFENIRLASIMVYKQSIYLEYDLENHGYWAYVPHELDEELRVLGPGQSEVLPYRPLPDGVLFEDIQLGAMTMALDEKSRITVLIHPDGTVTGHIVHVRDIDRTDEFSMRIASLTGFAEILDHRVEYEMLDENTF